MRGEEAAEDRADGGSGSGDTAPDAERNRPIVPSIFLNEQRRGRGHHQRGSDSLDDRLAEKQHRK